MAINKKLVNFKKKEDYTKQKEEGNILDSTIVFIDDAKEIVTHNTVFSCNGGADWDAKEGEEGYIKNKPIETAPETIAYDAKVNGEDWHKLWYTGSKNGPDGYQYNKQSWGRSENASKFPTNKSYKVNIDGKVYIVKPQFKCDKMYLSNGEMSEIVENYMVNPKIGDFFIPFSLYSDSYSFTLYVIRDQNDTEEQVLSDFTISVAEYDIIKTDLLPITQTTGQSKKEIMSQKAVTDSIINTNTTLQTFRTSINNISDWDIQEFEGGIKNKPFGTIIKKAKELYNGYVSAGSKQSGGEYDGLYYKSLNVTLKQDVNTVYYIKFGTYIFTSNVELDTNGKYCIKGGSKEKNNDFVIVISTNSIDLYYNVNSYNYRTLIIFEATEVERKNDSIVTSVTVNGEKKTGDVELGDIVTLTFDGDLTFDSTKYFNGGSSTYGNVKGESVLSLGDKYLVIYEGEKYFLEVKASRDNNNYLFYYLSPKELTNKTYPQNNLSSDNPFVIYYNVEGFDEGGFGCYYFRTKMSETKSVSSYKLNSDKSVVPTSNLPIVQETGESETQIMSQKAVTDALVKLWKGSEEEYNALGSYDDNTIYVII